MNVLDLRDMMLEIYNLKTCIEDNYNFIVEYIGIFSNIVHYCVYSLLLL